jgi:putative transposase
MDIQRNGVTQQAIEDHRGWPGKSIRQDWLSRGGALACEVAGSLCVPSNAGRLMIGSSQATPGPREAPAACACPDPGGSAHVLRVAHDPRVADMPPERIVPILADEGAYIASEPTFAHVLREHGQRGAVAVPEFHRAPGPTDFDVETAPR